ncbi:MAG: CheR family methyltransferase [Chloroflexota bacterium]
MPDEQDVVATGNPTPEGGSPRRLVVIGSSAGGIQALSTLVGSLRADFAAPVVLAQHLDPGRPSNLTEILERRSTLPIVKVTDRVKLEPGKIYVVPSNNHVIVADGHLELESDNAGQGGSMHPSPSVDTLLKTAAQVYGDCLIAVILTGTGMDGAAGAVEVKNAGGTVIIQNPHTARFPSMPLALPPTAVDHIVELENLGQLLSDLISDVELPSAEGDQNNALQAILAIVTRTANIDFRQYKSTTILRRIGRRMVTTHCKTMRDYSDYLIYNPEEVHELVKAFLIKVTEFFRDPEAFQYLENSIVPQLIEAGRTNDNTIRLWSVGCATGEEPYSLALMLADVLGAELNEWKIKIFATDLDEGAIAFARRGLYPGNVLNNLPKEYKARFFERVDSGYRVAKPLRQMVIFGQQDISRGVPFPNINLVLCRNLLIYFKPELQQQVLDKFAFSLYQARGFLFLGHAETVRPSQNSFELMSKKWKIYQCTRSPQPTLGSTIGPRRAQRNGQEPGIDLSLAVQPAAGSPSDNQPSEAQPISQRRFNDLLLRLLPFGVAIIDRSYRIVSVNAVARRLLNIRDGGPDHDFLHAARGIPYAAMRSAIDNVFRERTPVSLPETELDESSGGNGQFVNISVLPIDLESGKVEMVMISVQDATDVVETRRGLQTLEAEQAQLLQELQITNRRLSDMNKELQDANEELQAANEELMLSQEELQATNEEFEATNEELQATNEELETNNEELQATNEELETTNEELAARSQELDELSSILQRERSQLSEMVMLAPHYIMVLRGERLIVEAFNPVFQTLISKQRIVGLPVDDVLNGLDMVHVLNRVWAAYHENEPQNVTNILMHVHEESGRTMERYFNYNIVPIHDENGVAGVIIYASDVTEQLAHDVEQRRERLRLMVEHADQVALGLFDAQTEALLYASPRYIELLHNVYNYPPDTIIGRPWGELLFGGDADAGDNLFKSVVSTGEPRRLSEVQVVAPNSEAPTVWDYSLTPIPSDIDGGEPSGIRYVAVSAIEVTEQVRVREQLVRLDEMKDIFLSSASHELRTPLVPLMGYSDLLVRAISRHQDEPGWDPRVTEYAGKFRRQLKHLSRLVNDLFDVARLENGKLVYESKPVDLRAVVKDSVEEARMIGTEPNIQYEESVKEPLIVTGDAGRLVQVVVNLLSNSIKYASESKEIRVKLVHEHDKALGDVARIVVEDFGPGISPKELDHVFARFYQSANNGRRSKDGLGLGLYISKMIVEEHKGMISAKSTVGKGTTLTILLPLAKEKD